MKYGSLPILLGELDLRPREVFYYLYLPVSMPSSPNIVLPDQLKFMLPMLEMIRHDEPARFFNEHVYVTAKRMFVGGGVTPNRPGWHADGFLTEDLNYIWYDCVPTVFNSSEFNITPDHMVSLKEFEAQALPENNVVFPNCHVLKLDSTVVHAVGEATQQVMRTFLKVSLSPDRYNLSDNSHNYGIAYNWKMHDRAVVRNDPHQAQRDSALVQDDHFA